MVNKFSNKLQVRLYEMSGWHVPIYPQATRYADGTEKLRTEYQNGWNACASFIIEQRYAIDRFLKTLPSSLFRPTSSLLVGAANVSLVHNETDKTFHIQLNLNDTFDYACADCERVDVAEAPKLLSLYKRFGHSGLDAYCAVLRNEEVIKERRTPQYLEAVEYLKSAAKGEVVQTWSVKNEVDKG